MLMVAWLTGCVAHAMQLSTHPSDPLLKAEERISSVAVHIENSLNSGESGQKLHAYHVARHVREHVAKLLRQKGMLADDGQYSLTINIIHFNLTEDMSSLFLGSLAGEDMIRLQVFVQDREGGTLGQFKVGGSLGQGGLMNFSSHNRRLGMIIHAASQRIVQRLQGKRR